MNAQATLPAGQFSAADAHVAHHFESAQQQFDAGKLGMWLFLVTEVLFFSGLFVAYAVYRVNHPEMFVDAHKYLNTTLGGLNTIVLLLSSLTMAWAVRCAQLGKRRALIGLLVATLACAGLFLGVKAVEYSHKWGEGLLWAGAFVPAADLSAEVRASIDQALGVLSAPAAIGVIAAVLWVGVTRFRRCRSAEILAWSLLATAAAFLLGVGVGITVEHFTAADLHHAPASAAPIADAADDNRPSTSPSTGVFFSIYYAMTGVHAIHILAGMGVISWLLRRSVRGDFGPAYFGPVDYVGLYWHVVDLVWIYLFPLLYLIR